MVPLGQSFVSQGSNRTYFTTNAFSIFPGIGDETVLSGRLEFYFDGFISDQQSERIYAYDMNTTVADLLISHTANEINPSIFEDTWTGSLLGEVIYNRPSLDTDRFLQMDLSPAAITWLNSMAPNTPFAVGYSVAEVAPTDYIQLSFSSIQGLAPRLILETIPEASTAFLAGVALVGICMRRGRASASGR